MSTNRQPNGRINTLHHTNLTKYEFFAEKNKGDHDHFQFNAVRHIHTDTPVGDLFFSTKNIGFLQDGIRYTIYTKTNKRHIIEPQSETELQIIMRSMYLQYSKNRPENVVDQVRDLNTKVLDYVIPRILSELNQYVNYKHDITYLPVPLERSKNMSSKGTEFLHLKQFWWQYKYVKKDYFFLNN